MRGYDEAGGEIGYRSLDHYNAIDKSGADLPTCCELAGCRRLLTAGFSKRNRSFQLRDTLMRRCVYVDAHRLAFRHGAAVKDLFDFPKNACFIKVFS